MDNQYDDIEPVWTEDAPNGYIHINIRTSDVDRGQQHIHQSSEGSAMNETHTFPNALPDWSNLAVLHKNTLPPRASFFLYNDEREALTRDPSKSKTLSLSGTWKFSLAKSPFDAASDFFKPSFDTTQWGKIEVPGMWQLQGYGKGPQYVSRKHQRHS